MRYSCLLLALFAVPSSAQTFTDASWQFLDGSDGSRSVFGASLVDVNRDGRPDLYQPSRLFIQNESGGLYDVLDGPRFSDSDGNEVFGAVFGDANADGFPDIFVEDFDPGSRYFENRFGIRWDLAPTTGPDMSAAQSQGATWADFDQDGDLDLFVGEETGANRYFENLGDGVFRDTNQSGLLNHQHSYGVATSDYDRDGDLDVFIAACSSTSAEASVNVLFRNEGNGLFVDVAVAAGVADSLAGWAVVWLDYDRDSWPDIFIANMPIGGINARPGFNKLYRNLGDGTFEDVSDAAGVSGDQDEGAFGASSADFDNDGWEDIYVANGFGPHRLLRNLGDGTFTDILPELGLLPIDETIAVAVGDMNADGWIDIFTPSRVGNRLFINDGGQNHFLSVSLRGADANIDAIGARVTAHVGGALLQREITAGDGMTSQNHNMTAHFGLGNVQTIDTLVVSWPDGPTSRLHNVVGDQHLYIVQNNIVQNSGLNEPPDPPELLSPPAGSQLSQSARFAWEPVADGDGDDITYTLAILSLNDRTTSGELVMTGISGSEVQADLSSVTDGDYTWTVVAEDGHWKRGATESFTFRKGGATAAEGGSRPPVLALYPNPVSEWATLTLPGSQTSRIDVVDVLGRSVASLQSTGQETRLDLSRLVPGVYLIRAERFGKGLPFVISR